MNHEGQLWQNVGLLDDRLACRETFQGIEREWPDLRQDDHWRL
jgi:hypothetical protein